jgi:RNA polymerase sigma-70 factor (ECF subfamily)
MTCPDGSTDADLLRRSKTDSAPFRVLYDRYSAEIYRFHLRRTGDRDAALDLTAETFARAWFSRSGFRDRRSGSAGPWLYGIARHVLLSSVERGRLERSAAHRLGLLARAAPAVVPDESWSVEVEQAFDGLPATLREAVRLRVLDDMEYAEIARQVGCSPVAARIRVSRGLSALRSRLASPGLELIR